MTKFSILFSKTAEKQINDLDKQTKERIHTALKELEIDPFQPRPKADIKKLHKMSKHQFSRLRVGNYRVIYTIEDTDVKIIKIIPREKGYDWLD